MKRFWNKVEKTDYCWFWIASGRGNGYGCFKYKGKLIDAHRMVWFLIYGYFPKQFVLHHCDNRKCVNPKHLYEGTQKQNVLDAINRNRHYHTPKGSKTGVIPKNRKLTEGQIEIIKKEYLNGKSCMELGKKYDLHRTNIWRCIKGSSYANIPLQNKLGERL